jgi:hypothetical protein
MKKKYILIVLVLLSFGGMWAQDNSNALTNAFIRASVDSSYIAVNKRGGWQFLTSYLTHLNSDSVMIEMIVQHDRTIDWTQEQLVGSIKSTSMLPKASQIVTFSLISDQYQLRVEPNGRCYLRLATGTLPDGDPVIIPVRAVYKR